ncbi:MAG: DinB family protein, partial [Polaromonas sp.]
MPNTVTTPPARLLASRLERFLAYHGWAYNRLLAGLEALDEDSYRAPCGLFFGSVHGTLNHLAVADRIWLARVRHALPPFTRLDVEAVSERGALAGFLADGVHAWRVLLSEQDDQSLSVPLAYRNMRGEPQLKPLADIVLHLVNH